MIARRKEIGPGTRLGKYIIEAELARGGMGRVFRARHVALRRPVAVKVMYRDPDPAAAARFEREIQLSVRLSHPNSITIFDCGRTPEDEFYYVMELLEGVDLQDCVERFGPMPAERAVFVSRQLCDALGEAHSLGIIHRDIKPSNIFITRLGDLHDWVKVLDFGLAKRLTAEVGPTLTLPGEILGSPRYLSPESLAGTGTVDARGDIYSLGGVMYWLLTGWPPFRSRSASRLMVDHATATPRRPSQVSELPIPKRLDRLVLACLEKKPEDRPQTIAEVDAVLGAVELDRTWDHRRARRWWEVHGLTDSSLNSTGARRKRARAAGSRAS